MHHSSSELGSCGVAGSGQAYAHRWVRLLLLLLQLRRANLPGGFPSGLPQNLGDRLDSIDFKGIFWPQVRCFGEVERREEGEEAIRVHVAQRYGEGILCRGMQNY